MFKYITALSFETTFRKNIDRHLCIDEQGFNPIKELSLSNYRCFNISFINIIIKFSLPQRKNKLCIIMLPFLCF